MANTPLQSITFDNLPDKYLIPVQSVNGQTGDVVLDAEAVGALPDDTTAADLGAYVKPSGGIPASDLASAVQTSLGKADEIDNIAKSNKAEVILMNNGRFNINVANRTISFSSGIYLFTSGGRISITAATTYSQIQSYSTYDSGSDTITVTVPNESVFAYNISGQTAKVCPKGDVLSDDVILFGEYYQNDFGLAWDKYWRDKYIDNPGIPSPSSPATGAFLVYNGSAWVAQTLSTWQGGNY